MAFALLGLADLLTAGQPPEVGSATPDVFLRAYGLWVLVGGILVLWGLCRRPRADAARTERAGHALITTGLAVLFIVLLPSISDGSTVASAAVSAVLLGSASAARWLYLSRSLRLRRDFIRLVGGGR